jgi:hypothetical protein
MLRSFRNRADFGSKHKIGPLQNSKTDPALTSKGGSNHAISPSFKRGIKGVFSGLLFLILRGNTRGISFGLSMVLPGNKTSKVILFAFFSLF